MEIASASIFGCGKETFLLDLLERDNLDNYIYTIYTKYTILYIYYIYSLDTTLSLREITRSYAEQIGAEHKQGGILIQLGVIILSTNVFNTPSPWHPYIELNKTM